MNVNEYLSSVSSAFDLKLLVDDDRVRDVVLVGPGDGRAGFHRHLLRTEGEVSIFTGSVRGAPGRRRGQEERGRDARNSATSSAILF